MIDLSRRDLLKTVAALLVEQLAGSPLHAFGNDGTHGGQKVILLVCGGIRYAETFQQSGLVNIPHLYRDLLPQSTFFPSVRNEGTTSHFNTTSSILTGNWQRTDDWGRLPPATPTIFEYLRKSLKFDRDNVWFISSNKALTKEIGASSVRDFGPRYGANVVFPKQLLINAVVHAASEGRAANSASKTAMQAEIEAMLESDNYEGLGWSVSGETSLLDLSTHALISHAIEDLVRTNAPVTGDEFTFLVSKEVMRRFAPSLLVISFSDVEVAHFGSYSMHMAGIRTLDRLVYELWGEVQANTSYRDKTTVFVLPEFGRDLDGSATNGFFNHRLDNDSTRRTWMMCLGAGAAREQVVQRVVRHIDLCPTIAQLFGVKTPELQGNAIGEIRI